jgi:hypothetical protein
MIALSSRRRAALAAILALALAAVYAVWWHHLAETLRQGIERWAAARRADGWTVATGSVTVSGFPFGLRLSLAAPSLADGAGDRWDGPPLTVDLSPLQPVRPHLTAAGKHMISLGGTSSYEIEAGQATADLSFDDDGLGQGTISLASVQAGQSSLGTMTLSVDRLAAGSVPHTQPTWAMSASLDSLTLPADPRLLLGRRVASAHVKARVLGRVPPGPLPAALGAWRDDGGTVEIEALAIDWPPLDLGGTGTVALDRDMQPMAAGTCSVRGLFATVDALVRSGVVTAQDGRMAKLVLGLLAKPAAGGDKELAVPLTIENRFLYVGPVQLLRLPEMAW